MKLVVKNKKARNNIKIDEFKLCIFIFMLGGIIGFCVEEIYDTLRNLKFDKNGFLYGFFLPIYGWGVLIFHLVSKVTKRKPLLTFISIMLFAGILEYLTGAIILEIWNKRFWDYSSYFMNLNGHICLFSVLTFGILGTIYVYFIEPLIIKLMCKLGEKKTDFIIKIFLVVYLIDNIFSFLIKNKF